MISLGIILVSSAGFSIAQSHTWSSLMFLKKHLIFLIFGLISCTICALTKKPRRIAWMLLVIGLLGVIFTLFFSPTIKGARRWINIGIFSLQPAELMKLGLVINACYMMVKEQYYQLFIISAVCLLLLGLQPDFGSILLITTTFLMLFFIKGTNFRHMFLAILAFMGVGVIGYCVFPHVQKRVDIFLYDHKQNSVQAVMQNKFGKGYQISKATQSFKSGGLIGKGPGSGTLKHYLPDAHADFIFAVAAEEFGILGCIVIVLCQSILMIRVCIHANRAQMLSKLLICGLGGLIFIQGWFHMLSNLNLMPTKGFSMPLIGYGGTGLATTLTSIGFLLNLTKHAKFKQILSKKHKLDV